jgi:hypothetical protein
MWVWCGVTGDLNVISGSQPALPSPATQAVVIKGVPANTWVRFPVPITQILATNTTATNIVVAAGSF